METAAIIFAYGMSIAAITFARRHKNPGNPKAGIGVAGWGLFGLILLIDVLIAV